MPIDDIQLISLDRNNESVYIRRHDRTTILRASPLSQLGDDCLDGDENLCLLDWFASMKELGVNFTILN